MAQATSRSAGLRPREQFWLDHLRSARRQGQTLKAYAQAHGRTRQAEEDAAVKGFPTRAPAELEPRPQARRWMVEALWSEQGVGIVGGEPKCGKSFLALDLAVAVAAGVPCLRHFHAARSGPVLLFAAEDAGHIVRARLQGIASLSP